MHQGTNFCKFIDFNFFKNIFRAVFLELTSNFDKILIFALNDSTHYQATTKRFYTFSKLIPPFISFWNLNINIDINFKINLFVNQCGIIASNLTQMNEKVSGISDGKKIKWRAVAYIFTLTIIIWLLYHFFSYILKPYVVYI